MSSSTLSHKFLLDENVKKDLFNLLKGRNIDVTLVPKSTIDLRVANISKLEHRILVTNDEDFSEYSDKEIFAVIWLRIPQNDSKSLLFSFEKLLSELKVFKGQLILLESKSWRALPLIQKIEVK